MSLTTRSALFAFILMISVSSILALNVDNGRASNATDSERHERFISLFTVVRFANSFCYGSNGYNGTCLTSAECATVAGTTSGTCAGGFGVCCTIFVSTCGKTVNRNNTYWLSPGYGNAYSTAGQCSIYVKKCDTNICQLRLDFITFLIANPDGTPKTATECLYDSFTVSGQSNNVPGICGNNTDQHMYLDMTPGTTLFTLNMLLTGTNTSRYWNIRISQIPCGTTYTAPDNCLQYFTSSVGTFSSFNYVFSDTPIVQHLAYQDYTICIRMNQGFCGICYSVCDHPTAQTKPFLLSTEVSKHDAECLTDWLQIPCATDQQSSSQLLSDGTGCVAKICGNAFTADTGTTSKPVYSYRKPFEVRFYTDSNDAKPDESIGFCLKYQQLACNSG